MLKNQREVLENHKSECISIGITKTGDSYAMIPVPWENTASAYNMKIPNVYISKDDLNNPEIVEKIKQYKVIGLYIDVPLDDYSFLKDFPDIMDLNILNAANVLDLSFLESLTQCRMFYIEGAKLKNLNSIVRIKTEEINKNIFDLSLVNIGLCNCNIEDISGIDNQKFFFSEFLVWGNKNEEHRWKNIRAGNFNFFELRNTEQS